MRQRITLLAPNTGRDSYGEALAPTTFATAWAQIQMLAGKYSEKQEQVITEATHKITMRYMSGITTAMKVQYDSRIFDIEAVFDPNETKRVLVLFCFERNNGRAGA